MGECNLKNSIYHPLSNTVRLLLMATLASVLTLGTGQTARAFSSPAPVNLGAAASFAILTKTGITNVPTSAITGNLGASPITAAAITGFSLIADSTNTFSISSQVTGKIYADNYADPTPSNLTTAVSNMEAAYTDAGRLPRLPDSYACASVRIKSTSSSVGRLSPHARRSPPLPSAVPAALLW